MITVGPILQGQQWGSGRFTGRLGPDLALRDVMIGNHRALDAISFATRDDLWRTSDVTIEEFDGLHTSDGFELQFRCTHRSADTDLRWTGRYSAAGGVVELTIVGVAGRDQQIRRAGFVLLHPLELRGHAVQVRTPAGLINGSFDPHVNPHPLFTEVQSMITQVAAGTRLQIDFDGDLFETEDHRNWTDAGWKTYCTPLARPAPRFLRRGDRIHQGITISAVTVPSGALTAEPQPDRVTVGSFTGARLPHIGSAPSGLDQVTPAEVASTIAMRLAYLHLDLAEDGDVDAQLKLAEAEARTLGLPLRLGITTEIAEIDGWVGRILSLRTEVESISVFHATSNCSSSALIEAMKARLAVMSVISAAPLPMVGGGTRGYFAELNRLADPLLPADFLEFSISPEVHHHESDLMLDTVRAQPDVVRQGIARAGRRPLRVGPITLRQRLNVHAQHPVVAHPAGTRGPDADARQHTHLAAVWTLGAIAALSPAQSVTLFRTCGLAGIVPPFRLSNTEETRALQMLVCSLTELSGAPVLELDIPDSRKLIGLAVQRPDGSGTAWLANRTDQPIACDLVERSGRSRRVHIEPMRIARMKIST